MPTQNFITEFLKKAFSQNIVVLIELPGVNLVLTTRQPDDGPVPIFAGGVPVRIVAFDMLAQQITLDAGAGLSYTVGESVQFTEASTGDLVDGPNPIVAINGDTLTMQNALYGFVDQQVISPPQIEADGVLFGLAISPSAIDPRIVQSSIRAFTFSALDKDLALTALCKNNFTFFTGCTVRIFLGRSTGSFAFVDYYELPKTQIITATFRNETFAFSTQDVSTSLQVPFYQIDDILAGDVLETSTTLTIQNNAADFPASGILLLENEFMSYSSVDVTNKIFTISARAILGSSLSSHPIGVPVLNVTHFIGNPVDIFTDSLQNILGIGWIKYFDASDLYILKSNNFSGIQFELYAYDQNNFLTWAEDNLLTAMNCRLLENSSGLLTLKLLDNNIFDVAQVTIDSTSIVPGSAQETADNTQIINVIQINYDWNEGTGKFESMFEYDDELSIETYGARKPYVLNLKGVKTSLAGLDYVMRVALRVASRFSTATPQVALKVHMDRGLMTAGDVVRIKYNFPSANGDRNFDNTLGILQTAMDAKTGLVDYSLAFTSYSGLRGAYISPADPVIAFDLLAQQVTLAAGRGAFYKVGWPMQFEEVNSSDELDPPNPITAINGDTLTFQNSLYGFVDQQFIRFPDYDGASDDQKRYAFISADTANFADGKPPYAILF